MTDHQITSEADDLLQGASTIARWLGLTKRKVYNMREKGEAPVISIPGLGLCLRKSTWHEYIAAKERTTTPGDSKSRTG